MKSRPSTIKWLFLYPAVLLFIACDAFLLGPSPHANWDDPDLAVMKLHATAVDDRDIRLAWDWLDIERELAGRKPKVDEIIVKHRKGSPPESRLGGKKYKLKDFEQNTKPLWKHTFKGLEQDEEHHFALYMHEKGGRWTAPLYTSAHLDNVERYGDSREVTEIQRVEISTESLYAIDSVSYPFLSSLTDVTSSRWFIVYFDDIDANATVESLSLSFETTANATIAFRPLRIRPENFDMLFEVGIDRSLKYTDSFTAGVHTIGGELITEIYQKSVYHRSHGLVISADSTGTSFDNVTTPIKIDFTMVRGN